MAGLIDPLRKLRWASRKLRLPISSNDLVLDVGSGGNPHPRSDVLLERSFGGEHRCGAPLQEDRPLVIGDAHRMPFADKSFDFVIAAHVLEHSNAPERFLSELMRVGKAGYIETPNAVFERLVPYPQHYLEIMLINGELIIRKKAAPQDDEFFRDMNICVNDKAWRDLFYGRPELFHVRLLWSDKIRYRVINPSEWSTWEVPYVEATGELQTDYDGGVREWAIGMARNLFRGSGARVADWKATLRCPECHGPLNRHQNDLECLGCQISYPATPRPDFLRGRAVATQEASRK